MSSNELFVSARSRSSVRTPGETRRLSRSKSRSLKKSGKREANRSVANLSQLNAPRKLGAVPHAAFDDLFLRGPAIGQGAFGVVYRAKTLTDRFAPIGTGVAVKVVSVEKAAERQEVMKEIALLTSLSRDKQGRTRSTGGRSASSLALSPSGQVGGRSASCSEFIVCYYGAVPTVVNNREKMMIVMEFIEGDTLAQFITNIKRASSTGTYVIPEPLLEGIMLQLARGLAYIHSLDVMHRDVKPGNIMITNGKLKYIDFGLSCTFRVEFDPSTNDMLNADELCRQSNTGTPLYMAPEVFNMRSPASFASESMHGLFERADVWSLGMTFFELIYGYDRYADVESIDELRYDQRMVQPVISSAEIDLTQLQNRNLLTIVNRMCLYDEALRPTAEQVVQLIETA